MWTPARSDGARLALIAGADGPAVARSRRHPLMQSLTGSSRPAGGRCRGQDKNPEKRDKNQKRGKEPGKGERVICVLRTKQ